MLSKASRFALIVILSAFVAAVLVDPEDYIQHLKLLLLVLALALWVVRVACGIIHPGGFKIWAAILLFAVVLPGTASIIGILGDTLSIDEPLFQILKSGIVILLIPVVSSEGVDLTKHIIGWSFIIAVFILAAPVLLSFAPSLLFSVAYGLVLAQDLTITLRDIFGLGIGTFFYASTPVLLFPIAYYLRNLLDRRKTVISCILVVIFLAAVLCSGSRATIIGALLVVAALVFKKVKTKYGLGVSFSILIIMLAFSVGYFANYFRSDEVSNAIKLGHIRSYIVEFDDHPTYLLWGQGTDTVFYDQSWQNKVLITELSYFDMIRWFGLPVTAVMLIALFYPAFALARRADAMSYLAIPYVAYLYGGATNPVLICWLGLMVVSATWGLVLMHRVRQTPTLELNFSRDAAKATAFGAGVLRPTSRLHNQSPPHE
jgi:hypothetical protein